jgi:hypothetical protein
MWRAVIAAEWKHHRHVADLLVPLFRDCDGDCVQSFVNDLLTVTEEHLPPAADGSRLMVMGIPPEALPAQVLWARLVATAVLGDWARCDALVEQAVDRGLVPDMVFAGVAATAPLTRPRRRRMQ